MTQISSYYASVGVRVDNSAVKNVQSYLDAIKRQLKSFQDSLEKSNSIKVKIALDPQGITAKFREVLKGLSEKNVLRVKARLDTSSLRTSLKSFSDTSTIRISNFKVNRSALNKALNEQPQQQQQNLKGTVLSATISNFKVNKASLSEAVRDALKVVGNTSLLKVKNSSVDTTGLKRSLKDFSDKSFIRISNFKVNRSALNKAINPQSLKGTVLSATISNFRVNKAALNKSVRGVEIGAILLKHFRVDRKAISEAVNRALGANAGQTGSTSIRLGARLSRDSITTMREQVRQGLSNIVIRPSVNARVSTTQRGGSGSGGGGTPPKGGWSPFQHSFGPRGINPFIFGGMAGGMIRYGAFALPGIAGVLGLNALTNTAMEMQSQRMALSMTAGDGVGKDGTIRNGDYYYDYLNNLGERVGKKTTDLMPDFTQMLAATRGTALEDQLESSFAGLVQYGSVMGLSDDQMKRSTRAFSQMVSKQQVMAEELKG